MKRPLMAAGIAFVVGVAAAWLNIYWIWIFLAWVVASFLYVRWTGSSYKYVVGLSVFLLVGFCRSLSCMESNHVLSESIQLRVYKIQEKEKVTYLYGKDEHGTAVLAVVDKKLDQSKYYKGQVYDIFGEAEKFSIPGNPGQFNEADYYESQGVSYRIWVETINKVSEGDGIYRKLRWLEKLKQSLCLFYKHHMHEKNAGILQAAVVGERSELDIETKTYYQENGWMHLITTSGLHLSFVAMGLYRRLRKMTVHQPVSTIIAFGVMMAYGYMTDFGDSMLRAIGMMIFQLMGKLFGRRTDGATTLFFLAALMLFLRPARMASSGFWLTYTAVGGMEFGNWIYKKWLDSKKENKWIENICIQIGIFVVTLPVLLWFIYEIPVYGFFYNFFMIPLISLIVPVAFVCGLFGIIRISLFQKSAGFILECIDKLFEIIHHLPAKTWVCGCPKIGQLIIFVCGMVVILVVIYKQKWKCASILLLINIMGLMFFRIRVNQVIFVDVGQGDGICVLTDTGQAVLVDGGSSDTKKIYTYRLKPLLKYYGIDGIDAWFLTHGDLDHVSGIQEALDEKTDIQTIFLPDIGEDEIFEEIRIKAEAKGVCVQILHLQDCIYAGDFVLSCLYPKLAWTTGDKNADSLVMELRYQEHGPSILLTGDIEKEGEKQLLEYVKLQKNDILKVSHHGSSGGTSDLFLEKIQPSWAIISCGKNNRYGHPHKETIQRLEKAGCQWVTTADFGAICVQMNSDGYKMIDYQKKD